MRAATISPNYSGEEREKYLSGGIEVKSISRGVEWTLRAHFARPLYFLMGMTGLILVLACVNLASLLFEISARDPVTLAFAALVLLCVGILGGFLPALWASRVEPMAALRGE